MYIYLYIILYNIIRWSFHSLFGFGKPPLYLMGYRSPRSRQRSGWFSKTSRGVFHLLVETLVNWWRPICWRFERRPGAVVLLCAVMCCYRRPLAELLHQKSRFFSWTGPSGKCQQHAPNTMIIMGSKDLRLSTPPESYASWEWCTRQKSTARLDPPT